MGLAMTGRRGGLGVLAALGVVGSLFSLPQAVQGQSLHLAELFAEQGRVDDARAEVAAWFEIRGIEATPAELLHGVYLRARISPDPAQEIPKPVPVHRSSGENLPPVVEAPQEPVP